MDESRQPFWYMTPENERAAKALAAADGLEWERLPWVSTVPFLRLPNRLDYRWRAAHAALSPPQPSSTEPPLSPR